METQVIVWCGGKEGAREAGGSNPKCTTTGHGCSNINLCYYRLINVLLPLLVTHLISVLILNVTMVSLCNIFFLTLVTLLYCVSNTS